MLKKLIYSIIKIASMQPHIQTIYLNDVLNLNNHPDIGYSALCIAQEQHQAVSPEDNFVTFNLILYYIDRLTIKKDNDLDAQSEAIDVLHNILKILVDEEDCIINSVSYTTFNQRFKDECTGAFARVSIKWPVNNVCSDSAEGDFNIDFNEDFFMTVKRS